MHARPAQDWTIEELARDVGLSRSVLAERFTDLVGMPPMHYLAKWRMQIASGPPKRRQQQYRDRRRRDRLWVRGGVQPRLQEDDGRAALGLAPPRVTAVATRFKLTAWRRSAARTVPEARRALTATAA